MFLLRFLWKHKVGVIIGAIYTLVSWISTFPVGCAFFGHDYYPFCETSIGEFLFSLKGSGGVGLFEWGITILAVSFAFLTFPLQFFPVPSFPNLILLILSLTYVMFLGAIIEDGLKRLFHKLQIHKS